MATQDPHEPDLDILSIARVCHEAIRAWCTAIGQDAAPPWDEAPAWMHEASLRGVTFRLENLDAPASAQHDQWMQQKINDGWVYGPVKDGQAKTHPQMIPWKDLPLEERKKDVLFSAVVKALALGCV